MGSYGILLGFMGSYGGSMLSYGVLWGLMGSYEGLWGMYGVLQAVLPRHPTHGVQPPYKAAL